MSGATQVSDIAFPVQRQDVVAFTTVTQTRPYLPTEIKKPPLPPHQKICSQGELVLNHHISFHVLSGIFEQKPEQCNLSGHLL